MYTLFELFLCIIEFCVILKWHLWLLVFTCYSINVLEHLFVLRASTLSHGNKWENATKCLFQSHKIVNQTNGILFMVKAWEHRDFFSSLRWTGDALLLLCFFFLSLYAFVILKLYIKTSHFINSRGKSERDLFCIHCVCLCNYSEACSEKCQWHYRHINGSVFSWRSLSSLLSLIHSMY